MEVAGCRTHRTRNTSSTSPRARRLAYALCGDADQADDLVQETATRLHLRWTCR
jgi:DNA-directed RNA polymerase specialized sigma24 family protein